MSERGGSQRERGATTNERPEERGAVVREERAQRECEGSQRERAQRECEGSQRERAPRERGGSQRERAPRERGPAAGGGRWVAVDPERLSGWLDGFDRRHGAAACAVGPTAVLLTAADGASAECRVPFPPLPIVPAAPYGGLVAHALTERRVGVLLVRLGGYAAGVFDGTRLVASKVGARHVQGRSAAGGWSQQRFARRRAGQANAALAAAADTAAAVLVVAAAGGLDAVVLGGDRRAADSVLTDPRLAALRPLVVEARLNVPDPRLRVLQQAAAQFRAIKIRVEDPPGGPDNQLR